MYFSVKQKLFASLTIALTLSSGIFYLASGWAESLSLVFHPVIAWAMVTGIAIIPGFSITFVYPLLLMDKRPQYEIPDELPDVSVLIAAYNEEGAITGTLNSILEQTYPGKINVIVVDDGSTDNTAAEVDDWIFNTVLDDEKFSFHSIEAEENGGKSAALNIGLAEVTTKYIVTIDADTALYKNALANLVTNIHLGPENTAAVAGNILVRNSRQTLMTQMQEWEYFLSIAASKRAQSLLQGTLVAQGAFSVYDTELIKEMGGWDEKSVGEDIVLTWGLQEKGYRCAYAENAMAFTDAPTNYWTFFKQRERWARGLIEAFKIYPGVIFRLNYTSPFIWVNLLLPLVDFTMLFVFVPGVFAAVFFGWYEIVSMMTLLIIPLIIILTWLMLVQHRNIFASNGLSIRKNLPGLFFYAFTYIFIMCPATVYGYTREIFNIGNKNWGTK